MKPNARHFAASSHCAQLRELLRNSTRNKNPPSDAEVDRAVEAITKGIGEYIDASKDGPRSLQLREKYRTGLNKLAKSMFQVAKIIAEVHPTIPFARTQSPPYPDTDPIQYPANGEGPLITRIELVDFHSVQKFIEHYGNAWKKIGGSRAGRPPLDAERYLISNLLEHWERVTGRDGDTSKKDADRQGRPTFRKAANVLQGYINNVLGANHLTRENMDTIVNISIKLAREAAREPPYTTVILKFDGLTSGPAPKEFIRKKT